MLFAEIFCVFDDLESFLVKEFRLILLQRNMETSMALVVVDGVIAIVVYIVISMAWRNTENTLTLTNMFGKARPSLRYIDIEALWMGILLMTSFPSTDSEISLEL